MFVCFAQQSFSSINNVNTSAIKIIANTSFPPSATRTTGTRSDNGNGNRDTHATTQQRNADRDQQQSFSIVNNVDTSAIKSIAMTSSPPTSATGTQQQQQLQRDLTMAMAIAMTMTITIATHRQQHSSGMQTGNSPFDKYISYE